MDAINMYTPQCVEDIARRAARCAIEQLLHPPDIDNLTNEIAISPTVEQGGKDMAYERRQVRIATNDDGSPVYKNLRAASHDEMDVKIVQAFIDSGRIWELLPTMTPSTYTASKMTVGEYAAQWLERKRKVKATTMVNYKLYINHYIIPDIGGKPLCALTSTDVQDMLDKHKDKAKKTLREIMNLLKQIYKYAISDGLVQRNPCESVDLFIPSDKEMCRQALDIEEYRDIISHLPLLNVNDQIFLSMFIYTGMRRGEVIGLRWEDIDFVNKEIHICRNATYPGKNVAVITTPKTKAGTRTIPLDKTLAELLEPHRSTGYVLSGDAPLTITQIKSTQNRIKKKIDLHGATLHVLRHSYLTYAVGETTDYKTVQGISGHADVFTLMNRYAHPQAGKVRELSESMHKILS